MVSEKRRGNLFEKNVSLQLRISRHPQARPAGIFERWLGVFFRASAALGPGLSLQPVCPPSSGPPLRIGCIKGGTADFQGHFQVVPMQIPQYTRPTVKKPQPETSF
ncbi:uncharacterized protein LOC144336198 [Macaca mulatta]